MVLLWTYQSIYFSTVVKYISFTTFADYGRDNDILLNKILASSQILFRGSTGST